MTNILLYLATALIWGSTWLAIQFQIGQVSPVWSVVYRFAIASVILIGFCLISRLKLRFSSKEHAVIALQGLLLFSLNYILYYVASTYFISGIIAVIFATISMMNIINNAIFFRAKIIPRVLTGSAIGLIGLLTIFWSEIKTVDVANGDLLHILAGLGIALAATYFASLGNMVSSFNQRKRIPILQTNALGMAYGTLFAFILALILGEKPSFDLTLPYLSSLLYLAIFGSIVAFGTYLKLLGNIGPDRAAYAFVFIPIIAMLLSTLFEDFQWHTNTFIGVLLVLTGNILVLMRKRTKIISSDTTNTMALTKN